MLLARGKWAQEGGQEAAQGTPLAFLCQGMKTVCVDKGYYILKCFLCNHRQLSQLFQLVALEMQMSVEPFQMLISSLVLPSSV